MGIVYIAFNERFGDIVKIGLVKDRTRLDERMKELSRPTGVPGRYECFYAVEVGGDDTRARKIEKCLHEAFKSIRIEDGEFFETVPEDAARFLKIAELMGGEPVTLTFGR